MKVVLTSDYAQMPVKASEEAAGFDLFACLHPTEQIAIYPGEVAKVSTGIMIEIPQGYFGAVYPRSGLATKEGLRLANCTGVIDSDYRGIVYVPLYNDSNDMKFIAGGDRIAQLVISPYKADEVLEEAEQLSYTARGNGGFGSTGSR